MSERLADFNGLELFFLACAVIGGFFVLVKLVLQFMGGDSDLDSAADPDFGIDADHTNSDAGFRVLSLHGLSSFFMMFGLVGLAFSRQSGAGLGITIGGSVLAGLGSVWIIGKLFQGAGKLQSSGTLNTKDAVGSVGTVYLGIPDSGVGRVTINFRNHLREFNAISSDLHALKTGTAIRVVSVKESILVVEPLT
ncbi:MAG: NfeD family protein [Candidatus Cloacimonetes bacterium]|nr:NfeD family protein [Candidatus Cloacimonadota bacterium]